MDTITKKQFIEMHSGLSLIRGYIRQDKHVILEKLNAITDIESHCYLPISNYGNLTSDKSGYQTVNIFTSGKFIFVETVIDNSKAKYCSRNEIEVLNTVYYKAS